MYAFILNIGHQQLKMVFDNDTVGKSFEDTFSEATVALNHFTPYKTYEMRGSDFIDVYEDGKLLCSHMTLSDIVYQLTVVFSSMIRDEATEHIATLHASSCVNEAGAIVCMGESGQGKTTLTLLLSRLYSFLGDEYGFLDIKTGCIKHERYPVQIKEGSIFYESIVKQCSYLPTNRSEDFKTVLVNRKVFGFDTADTSKWYPIRCILFPAYSDDISEPSITKLAPSAAIPKMLQASKATLRPYTYARNLMRTLSECHIECISAKYNSCCRIENIIKGFLQ